MRHDATRLERAEDRPRMPLVRTPRADRRGERDERRPDPADHRRDGESENRRDGGGQERDEQRADDEGDLLQRGLERVGGGTQLRVGEHPRPERAQRRADRRHQGARSRGADRDRRERRVEQRERTDGEQQGRKDQRARQQDPRLAAPVDEPAGDRSADRGGDEVRAGDRSGRRIAAAVLAHEEQAGPARPSPSAAAQVVHSGRAV